jgi:hypothetical protein
MAIQTSAGSTISIATGTPATYDAAGFNALTYAVVGEVTDIGEFGKEYATVNHSPLGNRQVQKFKGSFNNGSIQLQMARDAAAGSNQAALRAALASDANYSFKVTLQDGTKLYFTGRVMSFKTSVGSVDQITGASCTIEITSEVTEV